MASLTLAIGRAKVDPFALKPGLDQRADTLDVDDGCLVQKGRSPSGISYRLPRCCVVSGTYVIRARGASGSKLDTMRTGRVLAANPRSASQMSPGLAFIEGIEHFLHDSPRRLQIQGVGIGRFDHVGHDVLHVSRHFRPPGASFLSSFWASCVMR